MILFKNFKKFTDDSNLILPPLIITSITPYLYLLFAAKVTCNIHWELSLKFLLSH